MYRQLARLLTLTVLASTLAAIAATSASAGTYTSFDFRRVTNLNSTLTETRIDDTTGRLLNSASWRAGAASVKLVYEAERVILA
jgi:hypothetical protein